MISARGGRSPGGRGPRHTKRARGLASPKRLAAERLFRARRLRARRGRRSRATAAIHRGAPGASLRRLGGRVRTSRFAGGVRQDSGWRGASAVTGRRTRRAARKLVGAQARGGSCARDSGGFLGRLAAADLHQVWTRGRKKPGGVYGAMRPRRRTTAPLAGDQRSRRQAPNDDCELGDALRAKLARSGIGLRFVRR